MHTAAGQVRAIYFVSCSVLVAGVLQVAMLVPSLRAVGFRFHLGSFWTPAIRNMLRLSVPVALGAGVLQVSVLLDRGISLLLAQSVDSAGHLVASFSLFGHEIRYPMVLGAAARLNWAQYLYQFPLGVFAIALATAIFPTLAADAMNDDKHKFRDVLLRGIRITLWEGLPASVGLILVAQPAVQLLFERGQFTVADTTLVAASVRMYSIAIWAFSIQQILNRAYYALHDNWTPLVMAVVTLAINLVVEIPLLWPMGEAGMAAGTTVSYIVQAIVMLAILQRRVGSLNLRQITPYVINLLIATALMAIACIAIQKAPFFPRDISRKTALLRLGIIMAAGAVTYLGTLGVMRRVGSGMAKA